MGLPLHLLALLLIFSAIIIPLFIVKKPKQKVRGKLKSHKLLPQPPGAWPFIGHIWQLLGGHVTLARTLGAMADRCGPIFSLRLGHRQTIVMSEWELVKDCFTNHDATTCTRPRMAVSKYLAYDYAAFTNAPYGRYWREIRKISTVELLSSKRLEKMKHVRVSEVNSCLENLYKECTIKEPIKGNNHTKFSIGKWFEYLSFNIALCMIVGKRFSRELYDKKDSFASRFKKAIGTATHLAGIPVPSDFLPSIEWMDFLGYIGAMKETQKEIDTIIGHWLDEHIQRRKECQGTNFEDCDFMDVMLSNIRGDFFTSSHNKDTIIKATALTLLLTGSESTSITLTWAVSLLLNNPKVLKQAQEEIDLQVGKQRWVEESDITNLPYLQAIVKETLRLYPPSPLTGPREAMEDCHISDYHIPKGSRILVNIWKLHRDPRVWSEPEEFRPERFLNEKRSVDFRGLNFEYIPFSLGRRGCPGMTFGLQVVQLMLARLVQGFDMCTEDGSPVDMSEELGLALPKASPVHAMLAPRLSSHLYETL